MIRGTAVNGYSSAVLRSTDLLSKVPNACWSYFLYWGIKLNSTLNKSPVHNSIFLSLPIDGDFSSTHQYFFVDFPSSCYMVFWIQKDPICSFPISTLDCQHLVRGASFRQMSTLYEPKTFMCKLFLEVWTVIWHVYERFWSTYSSSLALNHILP